VSGKTSLRTGIWLFPDTASSTFVAHAAHCEAAGIDDLWVGDEGPGRDPFALLAAAAAVTARLRLAVGVTNPYLRHPAITAVGVPPRGTRDPCRVPGRADRRLRAARARVHRP
jgi:hypothetical protein